MHIKSACVKINFDLIKAKMTTFHKTLDFTSQMKFVPCFVSAWEMAPKE